MHRGSPAAILIAAVAGMNDNVTVAVAASGHETDVHRKRNICQTGSFQRLLMADRALHRHQGGLTQEQSCNLSQYAYT